MHAVYTSSTKTCQEHIRTVSWRALHAQVAHKHVPVHVQVAQLLRANSMLSIRLQQKHTLRMTNTRRQSQPMRQWHPAHLLPIIVCMQAKTQSCMRLRNLRRDCPCQQARALQEAGNRHAVQRNLTTSPAQSLHLP